MFSKAGMAIFIICVLGMFMFPCCSHMTVVKYSKEEKEPIRIFDTCILMPLGYYAIVKKDNKICAVRFLEYGYNRDHTKEYAIYEYYYQGDGSGDFLSKTAQHGIGKATYNSFCIIGRLCFNTGNLNMACGGINIAWGSGNFLSYSDGLVDYSREDIGRRIAPTKWDDIKDVNVFDTRLKWYKYYGDEPLPNYPEYEKYKKRKKTTYSTEGKVSYYYEIPIEELW